MKQVTHPELPLSDCPHCGHQVDLYADVDNDFAVYCAGCGCTTRFVDGDNERLAITFWNRRYHLAAVLGGMASKGQCSARKRDAAMENLEKANEARKKRFNQIASA